MKITYANKKYIAISEYEERMIPKQAGFRWDPLNKRWWTDDVNKASKLKKYADGEIKKVLDEVAAKRKKALESSRATKANIDVPVPEGLAYMPFQKAGIEYSLGKRDVLIGDEMGLGKTIQAIGIINFNPKVERVLVICPASLKINWSRELEKWLVKKYTIGIANKEFPNTNIVVVNYDILKKHHDSLRSVAWDVAIIDECHYLKNPKAQRTAEVLGKWHRQEEKKITAIPARKKIFLTGTPIVNRPIELWPILKYSMPESLGRNWKYYVLRYCDGYQSRYGWDVSGASNLEELQEKLRENLMVRRLKADVLTELPAKRRQIIELPINGYRDQIKKEKAAWERKEKAIEELQLAVELAKASEDPKEYEQAVLKLKEGARLAFTEIASVRHETALIKVPSVVEHILGCLEEEDKLVVFAYHRDVIAEIKQSLEEAGVQCVVLTGDTPQEKRQQAVDGFQNNSKVRVFIGNILAAGVGITLTASSHVVFTELDWVPGNVSQAEDRTHRIGQRNSVLVQHLVIDESIDAKMAQALVDKQRVIDEALDKEQEEKDVVLPEVPATKTARQEQIAKDAELMTPGLIDKIHDGLRVLASRCDGAIAEDGAGFNKLDTRMGKKLAGQETITAKQAALGLCLVRKYRGQIGDIWESIDEMWGWLKKKEETKNEK